MDIAVGKRLRVLRQEREVTQSDLAKELCISAQQYAKYEAGENRISISRLSEIATALDVTMADILSPFGDVSADTAELNYLALPYAADLLKAWSRLPNKVRRALLSLMKLYPPE